MRSIRSFFLTLAGLTLVAIVALFTASIGIAGWQQPVIYRPG